MSEQVFGADCFIICPIGNENSSERQHSDILLNHIFKPVLKALKYNSIRADQIPKAGMITTQIINLIIDSDLVIADLTDQNPNVFYELAIRHATNKPYIQIIRKGQKIPFDLSGVRTIEIDVTDLDNVDQAKKVLEAQIIEIQKGHIPDSPIRIATSTKLLQNNADLAEAIASRIGYLGDWYGGGGDYLDSKKIEELSRKLWGLREYSNISFEQLDSKLDDILKKLD